SSSQYGRICPIRSPEGPNIGVVTYIAMYARINDYGFMETPYKKVVKVKDGKRERGKVTDEIVYMQPDDEEAFRITHSSIAVDEKGHIVDERVPVRYAGDMSQVPSETVDFIDISPRQVVGLAAALIP